MSISKPSQGKKTLIWESPQEKFILSWILLAYKTFSPPQRFHAMVDKPRSRLYCKTSRYVMNPNELIKERYSKPKHLLYIANRLFIKQLLQQFPIIATICKKKRAHYPISIKTIIIPRELTESEILKDPWASQNYSLETQN